MLGTMEQRTEGMKKQAQELIDQAYNRGYKAGYDKAFATLNENWQLVTSEAEEKGRNEAWEAARKIAQMPTDKSEPIFNEFGLHNIMCTFSASEAIQKICEYEEKKKQEEDAEIRVGDEVIYKNSKLIGVVTDILKTKDFFNILWSDGSTGEGKNKSDFKKTGRHFQEIADVLKKMKEGE